MASVQNLLKNAIDSVARNSSTLWTAIGGRFYYIKDSGGTASPYVRYSVGSSAPRNVMGNGSPRSYSIPIYFDIFSNAAVSTEAETVQSYIHSAFDGTALSVSGYTSPIMQRGTEVPTYEEDTQYFHISIMYWIEVPKS